MVPSTIMDNISIVNMFTNKLRGLQTARELYRLCDRYLLTKFNANFCG
jgi:hypothetical protein